MKQVQFQTKHPCPVCSLGKYPSGMICETCEGTGWIPTMLGHEIRILVLEALDELVKKYGKSPMDKVAELSSAVSAKEREEIKTLIYPSSVKKDGSSNAPVSRPAAHVPAGASKVQVRETGHRHPSQAGPWEIP